MAAAAKPQKRTRDIRDAKSWIDFYEGEDGKGTGTIPIDDYTSMQKSLSELKKKRDKWERLVEQGPSKLNSINDHIFAIESEIGEYEDEKRKYKRAKRVLKLLDPKSPAAAKPKTSVIATAAAAEAEASSTDDSSHDDGEVESDESDDETSTSFVWKVDRANDGEVCVVGKGKDPIQLQLDVRYLDGRYVWRMMQMVTEGIDAFDTWRHVVPFKDERWRVPDSLTMCKTQAVHVATQVLRGVKRSKWTDITVASSTAANPKASAAAAAS